MKPFTQRIRRWLLALLTLCIVVVYVGRLMQIQIVDAQIYRDRLDGRSVSSQEIKAARGEILSRDGVPLAANDMAYDVIIDKAFLPSDRQNEIILNLTGLFEELGEEWNDTLPVSWHSPFSYEEDHGEEVRRLKDKMNVGQTAPAEDVMYWLFDYYGLEDYTPAEARKIAGIRYEMELRGFNMQTPFTFASNVDISTVIQVKERGYIFPGVDVTESTTRHYPAEDLAPHIIGTIGLIYPEEYAELKEKGYALNDTVGKDGIESAMESYLRGENGVREIYTDSYGDVIEAKITQPPNPGNNVILTIDSHYQQVAQESLEAQIKYLQDTAPAGQGKESNAGAVVMLNAKTGEVLAAATYPSYSLTTYREDYASLINADGPPPLLNRAINGQYAPGSTYKPTVALAGLSRGIIGEGSTVNCTMVYTFYSGYQPKCLSYHSHINVVGALSVSCNIFFYDVGRRTGIWEVDAVAQQLGLGEPTGIEIAEAPGQRSNPETKLAVRGEEWFGGDDLQSSIGQLLHQYTPLQLANYAATIGNRGDRMKLSLVHEIQDYTTGEVLVPFQPTVAQRMSDVPQESFETVVKGMVTASRSGSGMGSFGNYPIDVASKTGTPEDLDFPNSTFICFAPAEDPEIAIAVVIENGWHGYTGAPVAKALFDEYFDIDIRAYVNSGPQQLKDQRAREAASGLS